MCSLFGFRARGVVVCAVVVCAVGGRVVKGRAVGGRAVGGTAVRRAESAANAMSAPGGHIAGLRDGRRSFCMAGMPAGIWALAAASAAALQAAVAAVEAAVGRDCWGGWGVAEAR